MLISNIVQLHVGVDLRHVWCDFQFSCPFVPCVDARSLNAG